MKLGVLLAGALSAVFPDLIADVGAMCGTQVVEEGDDVVEFTIAQITLPTRQDDYVLRLEFCLFISEIYVHDILDVTVEVAQILDIFAAL